MSKMCAYCSNILSKEVPASTEPWNRILGETRNFVITPTVGSLVPGWVLIVSKRHVPAMGALTQEELCELTELARETRGMVESIWGPAVIFENGPAHESSSIGCGIYHAHFHIVPLKAKLLQLIKEDLRSSVSWETVSDIKGLSSIHMRHSSYLYVCESDENNGHVASEVALPSQFVRLVIARFLGMPDLYDYKKFPFYDNVIATLELLASAHSIGSRSMCEVV